jgi:hypothetical protein
MKITLLAVVVVAVAVVGCGGDDDASPTSTVAGEAGSGGNGGLDIAGSVDDTNLLVPRGYLQGEWCDSDGQTWKIEGDIARVEDTSGGVGEVPVDLAFIDNLDIDLVSQSDSEFVIGGGGGENTTFTRGSC